MIEFYLEVTYDNSFKVSDNIKRKNDRILYG